MWNISLDFQNTQTGVGDRQVNGRILSRLTMAKIIEMMGHDASELLFRKNSSDKNNYYPTDDAVDDILEFLDFVDADYEWDDESYELLLKFPKKMKNIDRLKDAIFSYWFEAEICDGSFEGENGEFEAVECGNNYILFRLEQYEGYPLEFFCKYFELLKENECL